MCPKCRLARFGSAMPSAQQLEKVGGEARDAETQRVDARLLEAQQFFEIGVAGVALERDLGLFDDIEGAPRCAEHMRNLFGRQQTRRAAAKEDAMDPFATLRVAPELFFYRRQVHVDSIEARCLAIEIAVRADRQTEREVDVESDAVGH